MRTVLSIVATVLVSVAPAWGQPMTMSASTAVMWLDRVDSERDVPPPTLAEPISLGAAHDPVLVAVWRGAPGWMFRRDDGPPQSAYVFSDGEYTPEGARVISTSGMQGSVRLELAWVPATREATVNGVTFTLPEGHNVVLVDDVDGSSRSYETLGVDGRDGEWIETFLGRSDAVKSFVRCDVPLPPDVFAGNERFRRGVQTMLDERCALMKGSEEGR